MLSDNQGVSLESLTGTFQSRPSRFTKSSRDFPAMITAMPQENGVFSIDMFDPVKRETVLSLMGTSMEYFLTQRPDIFARLLKGSEGPPPTIPDLYAYCQFDDLLLRSQLDCANSHLPRKYFDIKTRATMAIRYNVGEYQQFVDYRIHKSDGFFNSFNREFYDMMRSAFLKYSFQVRIGDMDGLFIAFHNTDEIFGFQYVSREDMDYILFGSPGAGNMYFSSCLQIFSHLLNLAAAEFDGQPFRMLSKRGKMGGLDVYAEMISNKDDAYERHEIKPSGIRKWSVARDKVSKGSQVEIDDDPIKENFSQHPSQPTGINCISYSPNHDLCAEYIKQRERYIKSIEGSGSPQETEKMLQWLSKYFSSIDTSHPVVFPLSRPEG
eukprot:Partr_v1_DN27676_c3_g1_i2_m65580 putative Mitochondrial mRNA processing protein PET127